MTWERIVIFVCFHLYVADSQIHEFKTKEILVYFRTKKTTEKELQNLEWSTTS